MELKLEQPEADLLIDILESHLGDLRMEIGKTENFDMRNELKHDEEMLKSMIVRLKATASLPTAS